MFKNYLIFHYAFLLRILGFNHLCLCKDEASIFRVLGFFYESVYGLFDVVFEVTGSVESLG